MKLILGTVGLLPTSSSVSVDIKKMYIAMFLSHFELLAQCKICNEHVSGWGDVHIPLFPSHIALQQRHNLQNEHGNVYHLNTSDFQNSLICDEKIC